MFSRSINDTSIVNRMMLVGDATTWSSTYDGHSDDSRGVIFDHNIFVNIVHWASNKLTSERMIMPKNSIGKAYATHLFSK